MRIISFFISKVGQAGFNKTFKAWLDTQTFREMIAEGKGKLEWERKVPDEKIKDLKELLNCDAFNDNLPAVSKQMQIICHNPGQLRGWVGCWSYPMNAKLCSRSNF